MSLFTVLSIGLAAWLSILVVVLAMCRAAAHADRNPQPSSRKVERDSPASASTRAEVPAQRAVLIGHN